MQSRSVYLYAPQSRSGSRIVAMGLMEMLKTEVQDVAYFKPVIATDAGHDEDIAFFKGYFPLKQPIESAYGITAEALAKAIADDQLHNAWEQILERFSQLERSYDFILCQGIGAEIGQLAAEHDLDLEIAANLSVPLLPILNARDMPDADTIARRSELLLHSIQKAHIPAVALFVTRVAPALTTALEQSLKSDIPCFCLPEEAELDRPTIEEIATQTGAKILTKEAAMLDRSVMQTKVAAMMVEHYLDYLEDGDLIIVPGDRNDIAVATFLANLSKNYPFIAGLLLTGGMQPPPNIVSLIEGADLPVLPMIGIDTDTQSAALMVQRVAPKITLGSKRKISLAVGLFNRHVDKSLLKAPLSLPRAERMTPVRFVYSLYEKARRSHADILLPESEDDRILRAAEIVLRRGLCGITLLGEPRRVSQRASMLGLDLSKAKIVDPQHFPEKEAFARKFYELRKHKGVILPMAREYMSRVNYFATMMLYEGYVDGVVSGATHTTRETIKPAFEIIKMREGVSLISSVFFMLLHDRVLVYGDCAVNPDPDAQELAEIALCSARTAKRFGIEPIVAMLSYSSGDSGVGADVEKVRKATQIAKAAAPDLLIEGPMQYDAAIDPEVAKQKMPGSKVAGRATVFIFPDLNTGNNTYKAVQRSAGAVAIGPILQGLKKPVNDLSRGCLVEDVVYTIAITAIQAAKEEALKK